AESALEKWLRRPCFQIAAFVGHRHCPDLRGPSAFLVGEPLTIRRERPHNAEYLARHERLRLTGAICTSLETAIAKGREDDEPAVRAPTRETIHGSAEGQARHCVPVDVVNPDVLASSVHDH